MDFLELIKVIFYGIVEGITEWLPVSSTGHLILFESFWPLDVTPEFLEMFRVVIQLGAILAVCVVFFKRLNPFCRCHSPQQKSDIWDIWVKVIIGCIPAGIIGLLLNDFFDEHFYKWPVVAGALILYGVAFILIENRNRHQKPQIRSFRDMSWITALSIGMIQVLALVPGTSRSGSTILGAMLLGVSRTVSAEYSFFLAIPVMFGASGVKLLKYGLNYTGAEVITLLVGMIVAFVVSLFVIRFLMDFIKRYSFKIFGYYRIALGILVVLIAVIFPAALPH
ncbi:undecaprenyl-diphosphate phosphatase [Cuneatibacter sp. NSJ-177]|uniref:undecaprenyl-diphosphate phosphatase n=1 Tax=Cuneatibacter sp. NSJ-177 TaxID=2931401 RepID=UPI001FD355FA|nr:undecaprenyl-diphosphate phosphatase [Cuneatibacter sp. NSJ-177]MCJ7834340.1 undecaprenyl-diphosphate phosphatase [Cuneatibacter sp. NSJ-177]